MKKPLLYFLIGFCVLQLAFPLYTLFCGHYITAAASTITMFL